MFAILEISITYRVSLILNLRRNSSCCGECDKGSTNRRFEVVQANLVHGAFTNGRVKADEYHTHKHAIMLTCCVVCSHNLLHGTFKHVGVKADVYHPHYNAFTLMRFVLSANVVYDAFTNAGETCTTLTTMHSL
ncbi:hypothetical protein J6590_085674 [Homalodisca vitripennis]|nr:hypothetical protein J6590_085674 [Homalodisca vitripennis]